MSMKKKSAVHLHICPLFALEIPSTLPKRRPISQKTECIVADALRDENVIGPFADAVSALRALRAAT